MRGGREEVGADSRPGVLLCVLPCLGFHRPDDYRLIPGDLSLTQEILPSVRLTEEVISLLQTPETRRGSYRQP